MSNITYHSLHDYVGGTLISKTFDLDGVTYDEHLDEIGAWLKSITHRLNDEQIREEWIICDYEDIPCAFVGEYSIDESFFDLQEAIDKSIHEADVFYAGVALGIEIESIEEQYYGFYESNYDLGQDYADSCMEIPSSVQNYIDYEAIGRDISCDYSEYDGHYFYS